MTPTPETVNAVASAIGRTIRNSPHVLSSHELARAALAAIPEAEPSGWRDISSAPKDFRPILGWLPRQADAPAIVQWFRWVNDRHCGTGWFCSETNCVLDRQPILWHPVPHPDQSALPSPPRDQQVEGKGPGMRSGSSLTSTPDA